MSKCASSWKKNIERKIVWHNFEKEKPTEPGTFIVIEPRKGIGKSGYCFYIANWYPKNSCIKVDNDNEQLFIQTQTVAKTDIFCLYEMDVPLFEVIAWAKIDDIDNIFNEMAKVVDDDE